MMEQSKVRYSLVAALVGLVALSGCLLTGETVVEEDKVVPPGHTDFWTVESVADDTFSLELTVLEGHSVSACMGYPSDREAWHNGEEIECMVGAVGVVDAEDRGQAPTGSYELFLSCEDPDQDCRVLVTLDRESSLARVF